MPEDAFLARQFGRQLLAGGGQVDRFDRELARGDQRLGERGEMVQRLAFANRQRTGHDIHDAQGADRLALPVLVDRMDRDAGIEARAVGRGDMGMVGKARV